MQNFFERHAPLARSTAAQAIPGEGIVPSHQDFLLYIPSPCDGQTYTQPPLRSDWISLVIEGQGLIYARLWNEPAFL